MSRTWIVDIRARKIDASAPADSRVSYMTRQAKYELCEDCYEHALEAGGPAAISNRRFRREAISLLAAIVIVIAVAAAYGPWYVDPIAHPLGPIRTAIMHTVVFISLGIA
jgi:hypothetical protein